jgi:pyruvate/2-oxoglutarate dehydrogenase complex dihydrolipoamide dehydrogenase (E3) component
MRSRRDVVVIGGGPGGLVVASVASQLGLKVTLVEKSDRLGGDCLHSGCVPSKTLIRSARVAHLMRTAGRYGLPGCSAKVDMGAVIDHVNDVIADIQRHDDPERFRGYGCEVVFGAARFTGPKEIQVGDELIQGRRFVIATGSRPVIPPVPGLEESGYETNETIFSRRVLPQHLAVIGSGPIGLELAQAYARLGSRVSIVEQAGQLLPAADADVANCVADVLAGEGLELYTGRQVTGVRRDGDSRQLQLDDDSTIECDRILVATGRRPELHGLGLDLAGVEHDHSGITVDRRLRTSQRHIHAIGDVCGPFPFTHMAEYQAGVVLANLLFRLPRKTDYRVVPVVTYTDPEIAQVGLTEKTADEQGIRCDVATFPMAQIDRAKTDSATPGFLKILLNRGRIRGASLVGAHAGELIHEIALAIQLGAKARAVTEMVHAYPTYAQIHRRTLNASYTKLFYARKTRFMVRLINTLMP